MKLGKLLVVIVVGALVAGCGGGSSTESKTLTIGHRDWDDNVAVSTLTKVLLEEELGYENVELRMEDKLDVLFQGVGNGDLDAFQDVWMPNNEELLSEVEGDVEELDPWFRGQTKFSLAVPTYVKTESGEDVRSIDQLGQTDVAEIIGIGSGEVIMKRIPENTVPEYGLNQQVIQASTPGMLAEVERRYSAREPFAFVAWSPHWMNTKWDFNYLEDPKNTLVNDKGVSLTNPSELSTIVRSDLQNEDPVAYAFMDEFTMTESQINDLENVIQDNDADPIKGTQVWLGNNREVVQPWVDAAMRAQQS